MARRSGVKFVPKNRCRTIYDMSSIGVRIIDIARYYNLPRSTVANIIRRYRNSEKQETKKKMGRKLKFSERGMRLLLRYVLQNCYESLHVIAARLFKRVISRLGTTSGAVRLRSLHCAHSAHVKLHF